MLDDPKWHVGAWGELVVRAMLLRDGWRVVTTADYSGRFNGMAPRMYRHEGAVVLADLDVSKPAVARMWCEVKTKSRPILWRKSGTMEHGIDRAKLAAYRQLERDSMAACVLCVVEQNTGEILGNTLRTLGEGRESDNESWPLVSWPRHKFRLLWRLHAGRLRKLIMPDGYVRDVVQADEDRLRVLADWLRPDQFETDLLHLDLLAQAAMWEAKR